MTDIEIIKKLGGTKVISDFLGYSHTRVCNWQNRGIPAQVKVEHPEMFMPKSLESIKPLTQIST